jgi:hypothetical protein
LNREVRGEEVRTLQVRLNRRESPEPRLVVDGFYGPKTQAAVMEFQRLENLIPSGMLWTRDWRTLFRRRSKARVSLQPVSRPQFNESVWALDYDDRFLRVLEYMATDDARDLLARLRRTLPSEVVDELVVYCMDVVAGEAKGLRHGRQAGRRLPPRVLEYVEATLAAVAFQLIDGTEDDHLRNAALLLTDLTEVITFEDLFEIVQRADAGGGGGESKEDDGDSSGARRRQPARRQAPAQEADEFDNLDQDQQAASLEAAAESGTPFCEKCEEYRRKQQAA